MSRLLVTGASGFVGRAFCAAAMSEGHEVYGVVRRESPELEGVHQIVSDILAFDAGMMPAQVRAVVHLASGTQGSADAMVHVAVEGTRRTLAAAQYAGVPRFVHVSSMSVYPAREGPSAEPALERGAAELDSHPELRGAYAASKIRAERTIFEEVSKLGRSRPAVAVVRPGLVFGPGLAGALAGTAAMAPLRLAIIQGLASQKVPVLALEDLCCGLLALLEADEPWLDLRVYDILGRDAPTKTQFLKLYGHVSGQDLRAMGVPRLAALLSAKAVDRIRKAGPATEYKVSRAYGFDPGSLDAETFWRDVKLEPACSPTHALESALTVAETSSASSSTRSPKQVAAGYLELLDRRDGPPPHRWIIVGAGRVVSEFHLPALRALESNVAALIDPDRAAARKLADHLDSSIPVHRSLADVAREVTDGATTVIATPGFTHHGLAMEALERGCHLLIEKPVASNSDELASLESTARESGATVSAIHNYRLRPNVVRLWRFLASHDIGVLLRAHLEFHTGSLMTEPARWMRAETRHQTLPFELAIHFVDIVCTLGGGLLDEPWTSMRRNRVGGGVAVALAGGRLQGGADLDLCVTTLGSARRTSVTLEFERASVELSFFPEGFRVLPPRRNPIDDLVGSAQELAGFARQIVRRKLRRLDADSPHAHIYRSHADELMTGAPNPFSIATARATISTIERVAAGWYA